MRCISLLGYKKVKIINISDLFDAKKIIIICKKYMSKSPKMTFLYV